MPKKFSKKKLVPLLVMALGVFVLVQVAMPEIAYKVWELTAFNGNAELVDPTDQQGSVLGISISNVGGFPEFISSNDRADLPYTEFQIAIPKIKLPTTRVVVSSNNFDHNLAQLPGTALPGEIGNVFISGHSSLPQFYSPTNFQAIFSYLPNVNKGDDILVTAAGQQFDYQVIGMKVVDPSDVEVINPPDPVGRYLTLMTCVPPGFNTKRLIVLTKLKDS